MADLDTSAFELIRALRDEIEFRIAQTDEFRALMALNDEIASYEKQCQVQSARFKNTPAGYEADPERPIADFDLKVFLPPPQETKRWWRKLG